jgi:hypothetical protein
MISGITGDKGGFEKGIMHYFNQFPGLKEVVLTDRGRLYLIVGIIIVGWFWVM